jgi:hypothetical protein
LTDDLEGSVEQWSRIFEKHPQTWRLLVHAGHIVGYWQFVSLADSYHQALRDGDMVDAHIRESHIWNDDDGGARNLYITMFAVEESHRYRGLALLWLSFIDILVRFAEEQGIFFANVCAVAYTKNAETFCQRRGMTFLKTHERFGAVYVVSLNDPKNVSNLTIRCWGRLPEIYRKYFASRVDRNTTPGTVTECEDEA